MTGPDDGIAVLLDVDGTLVDSVWLHTIAFVSAFHAAGHDVPAHRIHPLIGTGADRLVEQLIGRPDEAIADHHTELYLGRRHEIRPLPGARELVAGLRQRGARPVLASSASAEELDAVRGVLEIDDLVVGRTSSADADESKPEPDIFAAALDEAGSDRTGAVVVGDATWDVEAATRLGVPCIGVETGGWRRSELERAGAVRVVTDAVELLAEVEDGLLRHLIG